MLVVAMLRSGAWSSFAVPLCRASITAQSTQLGHNMLASDEIGRDGDSLSRHTFICRNAVRMRKRISRRRPNQTPRHQTAAHRAVVEAA